MRYSIIMQERRGAAHIEDAERILGGPQVLDLARKAGWLKPAIQRKRLTLFDYDECMAVWKRICAEGYDALLAAVQEIEG